MSEKPSGPQWVAAFAARLGVAAPTDEEFAQLLELAGVAAHSSERIAAPVACWLAARAGLTPADSLAQAQELAQLGSEAGDKAVPEEGGQ
jgi:Domain of unknown function (DUF6457)